MFSSIRARTQGHVFLELSVLFGILVLLHSAGGHWQTLHADDDQESELEIAELDPVKDSIRRLDLKAAEDGLKVAKKELKDRKRNKAVESAIEAVEDQISALNEYLKAMKYSKKRKYPQALRSMSKALRAPEPLLFSDEAEDLYSDIKKKMFYMINDFENEESRSPENFGTSPSGATAEVVSDLRLASDGRHALKVHFGARRQGIRPEDSEAYRAVVLNPPRGFSRDIGGLRTVQFSIISSRRVPDLITVDIFGGNASTFAEHPGIALNFTGKKEFTLSLKRFKFYGSFKWSDARDIRFSTLGPSAMDFTVDDVKFLR